MISLDSKEGALASLDKEYNNLFTHVLMNRTEAVKETGLKSSEVATINLEVAKKITDLSSLRSRAQTLIESVFDPKTVPHMVVNDSNKLTVVVEAMATVLTGPETKNKIS